MAGSSNDDPSNGPARNWWENTTSPFAPVPSHISIASSQPLSSVGTLPVTAAPRVLTPGAIGYEPNPSRLEVRGSSMRPHDLGSIPEGLVRSTVTAFQTDRPTPLAVPMHSNTGTNSPPRTLTPREEYQHEVPRYQNELSQELERVYGADWKTLRPQGQGDPIADQQNELQVLRMQKEALLRETIDRETDLRKFLTEHSMQTESMQEVIRTLDATRAEQQELYLKIEENEDELVQLRQLRATRSVQGDGQTLGLPTAAQCGSVLFGGSQTVPNQSVPNQGVQQQQQMPDHQKEFEQAYEHFKRTGCVPVPAAPATVQATSGSTGFPQPVPYVPEGFAGMPTMTAMPAATAYQNLQLPEVLPAPSTVPCSIFPAPGQAHLFNAPPRTAMFPTIEQLQAPSLSSLPSTNRFSGLGGVSNTPPSQGGSVPGSVPEPMAASARAAPGPSHPTTSSPSLNDLRKAKTTLPKLQFQGTSVVNLIRTWKEWTLHVQEAMATWHELAPAYWLQVLQGATGMYSRYCTLSSTHKTLLEANEQIDVITSGGYSQLVPSSNSIEIMLRAALRDSLPQGSKMLMRGVVNSERMLFDVMRRNLPSNSFVQVALVDSLEVRLAEPRTIAECSNKLRTYLQELKIAEGILGSLVATANVRPVTQINTIKVYQVLRIFVTHLCSLDVTIATKVIMLGDVTEDSTLQQLMNWAIMILGLIVEKVQDEKNTKQLFGSIGSSSSPAKDNKKPQANAAVPDNKKGHPHPKVADGQKKECIHYLTEDGCKRGSTCTFFHPRVNREDGRCYNCGSKSHSIKDCDRPRPSRNEMTKNAKARKAAGAAPPAPKPKPQPKGEGKGSSKGKDKPSGPPVPQQPKGKGKKGGKGKPKAKAAAADASASASAAEGQPPAGARFCFRLKPKMKDLLAEQCFSQSSSSISPSDVVGSSANASSREPDLSYALLDSGATHVILNLSKLTPLGMREGRSIGIRLAAGKQVGKIHLGEIFLRGVKRSLCPLGSIVKRLRLKLEWYNEKCLLCARSSTDANVWLPVMEPLIRNQLMYLSKDQFRAVRSLLQESRNRLDEMFYYGRWETLLGLVPEEEAQKEIIEDVTNPPPGLVQDEEQVPQGQQVQVMAKAGEEDVSYVDLFYEGDDQDDDTVDPNPPEVQEVHEQEDHGVDLNIRDVQEVQRGDEREAEYDDDDNASQATTMSFEQWEQQNADALNNDQYGFGLTNEDIDDLLFDEAGVQPDHEGVIPWDIVVPGEQSREIDEEVAKELEGHYAANHVPKDPRCPVCQRADGPVRIHKNSPKELKQTHILTVDLMGPFPPSYPRKFQYALVGAYRGKVAETGLPSPLLPISIPLKSKNGPVVADAIRRAIMFVESVHTALYEEGKRIFVVLSDRGSEFENRHVTDVLNDMAVYQNFTSGYSPQSSGAAEVNVRIIKQVMRRLLEAASFQVPWWSHALEYATQVLQCRTLSKVWDSPAFGEYVSVKKLEDKKKQKTFVPRGELGRLLVVRPMTDRSCEILVGSRIVRGTTPKPVSDKLAESMTREERRQVLKEVVSELDEEVRSMWEPVLTPMGNLLWINKVENYAQFRTPQFVQVMPSEPLPNEVPVAAAARKVPAGSVVQGVAVAKFPTSKKAKTCLKSCVSSVKGKLLPKNTSRTSLHAEDIGFPRSITLGLTTGRGYGIAHQTPRFHEFVPVLHKMAATRPSSGQEPYLSVQVSCMEDQSYVRLHYDTRNDADCSSWVISGGEYTGGLLWVEHPEGKFHPPREIWRTPSDASRLGYMYDTNQTWVQLPAKHLLHGVTKVTGVRVSMSYYVPSFLYSLDVSLAHTLVQLGFPVQEWVKRNPGSVYVPVDQDFVTAIKEFPKIEIKESRGVKDSETAMVMSVMSEELFTEPQAMVVQELQSLPKDVDKHFSELAKAHPISLKAVRGTVDKEREKWKESMSKELQGLVDRNTYEEVPSASVPLDQVQSAPARMVYVVKPALKEDGSRYVKRKSRLVICGNFLKPYGETSTANLDVSVLRAVITVGMTYGWKFASADIPQAFLYASIEDGRQVYLKPPKICVDFGLVPNETLWRLRRALYGLRESPKLWEKKRDAVLAEMSMENKKYGKLRLVQSVVHSSLWLIVTQRSWEIMQEKRKSTVRIKAASTVIGDVEEMSCDMEFQPPLGLLAVYVDDLLCAAKMDVINGLQTSVDVQWKTGQFQVLGEDGCDELVYLGTQIEYDSMYPDQSVILLHQERYTYELMEKFPDYFEHAKKRAVPGSADGFNDLCEPVDAPLSKAEQGSSSTTPIDLKLVRHLQSIGGSLLWLVIRTRPDMAWAYSRVASLITRHPQAAHTRMKEICRYLLYTGPMAMRYVQVKGDPLPPLDVYADISFAPQGQKSHEGLIVTWGNNVISWKSGRQSLTATSTSEAELLGAANADEALKAMYLVLSEMTGSYMMPADPWGFVWCDNQSAIAQTLAGPSSNLKTRHVSIKAHRLGEDIHNGLVQLSYVQSESQRADSLTKAYTKPLMTRSYEHLGLVSLYDLISH